MWHGRYSQKPLFAKSVFRIFEQYIQKMFKRSWKIFKWSGETVEPNFSAAIQKNQWDLSSRSKATHKWFHFIMVKHKYVFLQLCKTFQVKFSGTHKFLICYVNNYAGNWICLWTFTLRLRMSPGQAGVIWNCVLGWKWVNDLLNK